MTEQGVDATWSAGRQLLMSALWNTVNRIGMPPPRDQVVPLYAYSEATRLIAAIQVWDELDR